MTATAQIETTFRTEHGRVLAALISQLGDFDLAEDALQDALVQALESWERDGLPRNPGAWLMTVAKHRAFDRLRRANTQERHTIEADPETLSTQDEYAMDNSLPDDRLKFNVHLLPSGSSPGGAGSPDVAYPGRPFHRGSGAGLYGASAHHGPTAGAGAQQNSRGRIPYRVPPAELLPERLDALLSVIYLIFNEGYVASSGDTLTRQELCGEAIRLGRVLVALMPPAQTAEARGLLALMLLHDARRETRLNESGELVLLAEQDRSKWDAAKIQEGIAILDEAMALHEPGPYQVEAAISALHAEAPTSEATDWQQIAMLYATLVALTPSIAVKVNRAVAVALAWGVPKGLDMLLALEDEADSYYPYHAARADLLRRTQQSEAAAEAYERALALCGNSAERAYLQRRLAEMLNIGV